MNLYIDFEFSGTNKKWLDLICFSAVYKGRKGSSELLREFTRSQYKHVFREMGNRDNDLTLVSYNIEAELRAFFSLFQTQNIKELPFKNYICLHTEHKFWANKNMRYTHGDIIRKGKVVNRKFHDKDKKGIISLTNALYKFLGIEDAEHYMAKEKYRNMCIRNDRKEVADHINEIIKYCEMDTQHLEALYKAMVPKENWHMAITRGRYVAYVAEATQQGYYINRKQVDNLRKNSKRITDDIIVSINARFPDVKAFSCNKKGEWTFHAKAVQEYMKNNLPPNVLRIIPRTEKKQALSVSAGTFEKIFGTKIKHTLKEDDFLQQIYRYLYTRTSLSGIVRPKGSGNTRPFEDFLDPTEPIVRPFTNPYGSLTGRNQPAANSFLLAKPAWMRVMLAPPPDIDEYHYMVTIDIGKEEYLFCAVLSQDEGMLNAYKSGDPHSDFGLRIGLLTPEMKGTPAWHEGRHIAKTTVFMILYEATGAGLAHTVNATAKQKITPERGEFYISQFKRQYPGSEKLGQQTLATYKRQSYLYLADDWIMWKNNFNERSVKNSKIQGGCAEVYRRTVVKARESGIVTNMGQHDSFATYCPECDLIPTIRNYCRAICKSFSEVLKYQPGHDLLTLDIKVIGRKPINFSKVEVDKRFFPVKFSYEYEDERASKDLKQFRRYLDG